MSQIGIGYSDVISVANGMSSDVDEYVKDIHSIYAKIDEARNMWKGVDNNEFTNQVIASKPLLIKIGQSVEDHATFLRNDARDKSSLQNDIAGDAKNKLGE